jgi:hypothetical protein
MTEWLQNKTEQQMALFTLQYSQYIHCSFLIISITCLKPFGSSAEGFPTFLVGYIFNNFFMTYDRPLVDGHWGDQNTCPSTTLSTVHTTCSGLRLCWRAGGKSPMLLGKPLWLETDYFITAGLLTAEGATLMPNRDRWPTFTFNINCTSSEKKHGLVICKNCTDVL